MLLIVTRRFQFCPTQTASYGNKTQVYYPSRPRSQSAGSSMNIRRNGTRIIATGNVKIFRAKLQEDGKRLQSGSSRYKTELCRPFQEYGYCKYGDKCQFAHGEHELRVLPRHPKYKTELCRTYHSSGFCPYGPRCHFIHNLDEARKPTESISTAPKSPKKTLSFSLPISPSLDSGISSPDDVTSFMGSRTFEFPGSESSGSDEDHEIEQQALYLQGKGQDVLYSPTGEERFDDLDRVAQREQLASPDLFVEFDVLSTGSGSPTKPAAGFSLTSSDQDLELGDLFMGMGLEDKTASSHPPNGRRLPVFDDMMNSKSDTALLQEGIGKTSYNLFP